MTISERQLSEIELKLRAVETQARELRIGFANIRRELEIVTRVEAERDETLQKLAKVKEFVRHISPDDNTYHIYENLWHMLRSPEDAEPPKDFVVQEQPPYYDARIKKKDSKTHEEIPPKDAVRYEP